MRLLVVVATATLGLLLPEWAIADCWRLPSGQIIVSSAQSTAPVSGAQRVPCEQPTSAPALGRPRLQCPVGTCEIGGFDFGDDWTFNKCPPEGPWKKHTGADLKAAADTTVVAAEAGTVKLVYSAGPGWANAILIEHGTGNSKYVTQYMHVNEKSGIAPDVVVKRGQPIATVAAISKPHLHFGRWNGPYGPTAAQRGALPACAPRATSCNDGKYNDPCFPQLWVDPIDR